MDNLTPEQRLVAEEVARMYGVSVDEITRPDASTIAHEEARHFARVVMPQRIRRIQEEVGKRFGLEWVEE